MSGLLPRLAEWSRSLGEAPPDAEREARLCLIDTLACIHAGRREGQVLAVLEALRRDGALGRSRSVVARQRLPTDAAALVNGAAAHALDYDDYEAAGSTHPSAVLVAAILALCESRDISMGRALRAFLTGYEAICRVGEALGYGHYERGWHATSTIGSIGAAMTCATLMELSESETACALSLGATQAAGLKAQFGTDAKAAHPGLAARAGVMAALLAEAGLSAAPDALDGPVGFVAMYGSDQSPGAAEAASRIGKQLGILAYRPMRKPWPCCAYTHRPIAAALDLAGQNGFDAKRIADITLEMPAPYHQVCAFTAPDCEAQARFSVTHCVAIALIDGAVGLDSFTESATRRPEVAALRDRIAVRPFPLPPGLGDMSAEAPDRLTLRLTTGEERSRSVADAPGGPAAPMSESAILAKFGDRHLASRGAALLELAPDAPFRWSKIAQ